MKKVQEEEIDPSVFEGSILFNQPEFDRPDEDEWVYNPDIDLNNPPRLDMGEREKQALRQRVVDQALLPKDYPIVLELLDVIDFLQHLTLLG